MRESDIELYDKIVSKDTDSLETLYDRYESLLYSFIYKITQDKQSSEEVLQDVFMKIWNQKLNLIVVKVRCRHGLLRFHET